MRLKRNKRSSIRCLSLSMMVSSLIGEVVGFHLGLGFFYHMTMLVVAAVGCSIYPDNGDGHVDDESKTHDVEEDLP